VNKKLAALVVSLVICVGYGSVALPQAKPDVMVRQRQAAMTLLGKYFGSIAGMADGKTVITPAT
jgi:cytochrome c556